MPDYEYKLSNGKTLVLTGDTQPEDSEVESIAAEQGVSLLPIDEPQLDIPEINIAREEALAPEIKPEILEARKRMGYGRQDEQTFDLDKFTEGMGGVSNKISNMIGQSDLIPDFAKGTLATGAALIPESLNVLASIFADPTTAATSVGVGRALLNKSKDKLPEILPDMIPTAQGSRVDSRRFKALLPELSESSRNAPGFIGGEAGMAVNRPYNLDLGPNSYPSQVNSPTSMADDISNLRDPVTILPHEAGEIVQIPPDLAARSGTSLGRPSTGISVGNENLNRLLPGEVGETVQGTLPYRDGSVYTGTGHARPGEPQLPSAIRQKVEKQAAKKIEAENVTPEIAKTAAKVSIDVPELAPVINDQNFIRRFLSGWNKREGSGSKFTAKATSSIDSELANQHPMLGELVKQTQVDSHIKAGTWINQYDKVVDDLSESDFTNFVRSIEGLEQPANDKVTAAIRDYQTLDKQISDEMIATGAGLKSKDGTKLIPWQPREKYWPHLYTEEFFKSLKRDPTDVKARLVEKGMSPLEIDALLNNSKQFGERLIDSQHAREVDLPGYRIDKNVYRQHITDMAKRITEAKNYGPLDLADVESPLMGLIGKTKNPEYSTEMMKKLLNRGDFGDFDSIEISRKATAAQAWLHLSTAGISNLNSLAMTPIQTNTSSFVKGLADAIFNSRASGEFAKESGALQNIFKEIFAAAIDDTTKFMPTKVYGLDAGERFMRTISSSAGQSYAKQLFNEVKSGNASEFNLKRLQELTLTSPDDLMKQPELNPQQLKRAAFRTAELSQGLAEPQNLPQYWTGSGLANILTLFHKYQFAQTKIVKDLIKSNPTRTIPMLLAASQVAGEITGDSKAFIRGLIKSGVSGDETRIEDEIRNRGDFIGKKFGLEDSPLAARFIENMGQSFALGIYADVIEAMAGGGSDVIKQLAGSTLNDLAKLVDMGRDIAKGDYYKAATKGTSMVPLVGPPIASEMRQAQ